MILDETVIVVPVLSRPGNVGPLLESIDRATPEPHHVVFVATHADDAELEELHRQRADTFVVTPASEGYARKLNLALQNTDEPFIFQAADDLRFEPGWLSNAMAAMVDPTVGVVGTNDRHNPRVLAGTHSTHSLLRRSYVDSEGLIDGLRGYAMHEGYRHAFCDDEMVETAKYRGAFVHCPHSAVEHLHPYFDTAPMDSTYQLGMSFIRADEAVWRSRQHLWGGTTSHAGHRRAVPASG